MKTAKGTGILGRTQWSTVLLEPGTLGEKNIDKKDSHRHKSLLLDVSHPQYFGSCAVWIRLILIQEIISKYSLSGTSGIRDTFRFSAFGIGP